MAKQKRNRIWAVTFGRLTQDQLADTWHVKAREPEEAVRRAVQDAIDPINGNCPDAPEYVLSGPISVERLVVVSAMAPIFAGAIPEFTVYGDGDETEGEES